MKDLLNIKNTPFNPMDSQESSKTMKQPNQQEEDVYGLG
jgi:hypothetical protein